MGASPGQPLQPLSFVQPAGRPALQCSSSPPPPLLPFSSTLHLHLHRTVQCLASRPRPPDPACDEAILPPPSRWRPCRISKSVRLLDPNPRRPAMLMAFQGSRAQTMRCPSASSRRPPRASSPSPPFTRSSPTPSSATRRKSLATKTPRSTCASVPTTCAPTCSSRTARRSSPRLASTNRPMSRLCSKRATTCPEVRAGSLRSRA